MTCEICNQRDGAIFLRVTQPQGSRIHSAKAHACMVCHDILIEQCPHDNSTVAEISQQEYNEDPENNP